MARYQITANGEDMGLYEATSETEALDAYARDAGYPSYASVASEFGDDAEAEVVADTADLTLEARCSYSGGWSVIDPAGGHWRPDAATEAEIIASDDPEATALRICREQPMRGTWHS